MYCSFLNHPYGSHCLEKRLISWNKRLTTNQSVSHVVVNEMSPDIQCLPSLVTDYLIENEPLVNKYISVPRDKGTLNCASFIAGIIESVLLEMSFPAKVTIPQVSAQDKKIPPTYFMLKFDDSVISREKSLDSK